MRRLLLVGWSVALVACSFEHGIDVGGGGNNPDAPGGSPDAPVVVVDAPTVLPVDAKPADAPPCADDDSDGICNNVDDWPCGTKPTAPNATMTMTGNDGDTVHTITQVNLDATGRLAVAVSQENVAFSFHYDITDTSCPGNCVDQIEVGWVAGGRSGCPFDATVSKQNGATGNWAGTIRTPTNKGTYDLRANIGQNYSCTYQGATGWWGGTPAASRTIAKLCVH